MSVLDVGGFDTSSDAEFLEHLYIPGLRRAGDMQTAASLARDRVVIHNAGPRFTVKAPRVETKKLTAREIVDLIRAKRGKRAIDLAAMFDVALASRYTQYT